MDYTENNEGFTDDDIKWIKKTQSAVSLINDYGKIPKGTQN